MSVYPNFVQRLWNQATLPQRYLLTASVILQDSRGGVSAESYCELRNLLSPNVFATPEEIVKFQSVIETRLALAPNRRIILGTKVQVNKDLVITDYKKYKQIVGVSFLFKLSNSDHYYSGVGYKVIYLPSTNYQENKGLVETQIADYTKERRNALIAEYQKQNLDVKIVEELRYRGHCFY